MTHILEALKENLKLFEMKQDSYSDVVPELERMFEKESSKIEDNPSPNTKSTKSPKSSKQKVSKSPVKKSVSPPATNKNSTGNKDEKFKGNNVSKDGNTSGNKTANNKDVKNSNQVVNKSAAGRTSGSSVTNRSRYIQYFVSVSGGNKYN